MSGSSSIMAGISSAVRAMPRKGDFSTRISAVSSPPESRLFNAVYFTPSLSKARRIPVRVGLSPTFLESVFPFKTPRAIKYAAEEMSAGTQTSAAFKRLFFTRTVSPSTEMSAPMAESMRSVWSRDFCGSVTRVSPSAESPARRTALFTCAEATRSVTSAPCRGAGYTYTGARPADVRTSAPRWDKGRATRSMGREERDSSPTNFASIPFPAAKPIKRRMVVPEFPQLRFTPVRK